MNRASFQLLHTFGMNLYAANTAGIRRTAMTMNPSPKSRPYVIPVSSGWWNSFHGSTAPMYMNPPKLRRTSTAEFTSS